MTSGSSRRANSAPRPRIAPGQQPWRRISVCLDSVTDDGDREISLWTNLPQDISAATIARLYRKRWKIEGMFQRLDGVEQ